jgi:energy-coupling factor transporter ATP-binding protein EcfA2
MRFPSPGALDGCKSKVKTVASLTRLTFKYAGSDKKVLNNVSCKLGQTSRVALVGKNGAGKSTLLRLLVGDMSVTPHLGDRDMRSLSETGTTHLATPLTPHGPDIEAKPPPPAVRDATPPRAAPDNASNAGQVLQVFRHRNLRVGIMYMYVRLYVCIIPTYVCIYVCIILTY